ncbi:hypothetical protein O3M35_003398 [Rhynocoris fuscipes]|uniref:Uncharacterized protein n=1 Tax=Rhynocoris fuscipes TaxID=488301 RepID=A0AAW1CK76_9HEMI
MRAFQRYPTTGSNFSLVQELCPFKEFEFDILFFFFCFFNLTYDMMTRRKFYI